MTAKNMIELRLSQLRSAINRESKLLRERQKDLTCLDKVKKDEETGMLLPEDSPYASYQEWIDDLKKDLAATDRELEAIECKKTEKIALEFYIREKQL